MLWPEVALLCPSSPLQLGGPACSLLLGQEELRCPTGIWGPQRVWGSVARTHTLATVKNSWLGIPRPHPTTPAQDCQLGFLSSTILTGTQQPRGTGIVLKGPCPPEGPAPRGPLVFSTPPCEWALPHPKLCHTIICDSWSQACEVTETGPLCLFFNLLKPRVRVQNGAPRPHSEFI